MKIEYIADDGTKFESAEACERYEKKLNAFKLYDREGKGTRTFDMAFFVFVESTDAISALRDLAQSQNEIADGIDEQGFFVWNEWEGQYIELKHYIATNCNKYE